MTSPTESPVLVSIALDMPIGPPEYDYETGAPMRRPETLQDLIVERAAQMLADDVGNDLRGQIRTEVRTRLDATLTEKVGGWVTEALASPLRKTTHYGEPTGEAIPISEFVTKVATDWLEKPQRQSGSYGTAETRVQKLISEEVNRKLETELRDAVRSARLQVVTAVQTKAGEVLGEAIARANLLDGVR